MIYFDSNFDLNKERWTALGIPYVSYSVKTDPKLFHQDVVVQDPDALTWPILHAKSSPEDDGYDLDDMLKRKSDDRLSKQAASLERREQQRVADGKEAKMDNSVINPPEPDAITPDFTPLVGE